MNSRVSSIGLVIEVDRKRIGQEELDSAHDLCEDTKGKLYRIITFWIDSEGIEGLIKDYRLLRARISYKAENNRSANEGSHYQVEEILHETWALSYESLWI